MFQAEIHLQQEKPCVLNDFAEYFDTSFDVDIEELHDHRVTFTIRMEEPCEEYIGFFEDAEQVDYVERLDEANYLITKTSWGVLCRRPKPRCPPTTESRLRGPSRLYRSLLPPRGSRAMIEDFNQIGTVTLGKLYGVRRVEINAHRPPARGRYLCARRGLFRVATGDQQRRTR